MHNKAPHRPWEPDEKHRAQFANRWIPEPETLWDSYATRTDALHENLQRVMADMTRRDLKLHAAAWPRPERTSPRGSAMKPDRSRSSATARRVTLTGEALAAGSTSATCRITSRRFSRWTTTSAGCSKFLDSSGLARNTIVIYTSDQGFFLGDHGLFDKRFMYEESLRMPFLVRWPAGDQARHARATPWRSTSISRRRFSMSPG